MLALAHLLLLATWAGLILGETVLEFSSMADLQNARHVARAHYLIDLFVELPLLCGILVTGGLLLVRAWPPTPLLLLKVGLGVVAIAANLVCAAVVVARHRRREDPVILLRLARAVRGFWVAVPFGLAALYIGLAHFHH